MRTPTSRAGRDAGFTLLELIVVMTIIGMVMGIAATRFQPTSMTLERQGALLVDSIRQLRRDALLSGDMRAIDMADLKQDLAAGFELTMLDIRDQKTPLAFYPLGNSNGAKLSLKGELGEIWIEVDWLSGEPSIIHPQ